ncbi:ATP-binding protein [Pseudorhodoferax sp. Leaf274]|uniref:ATP-binding protein n=1 Tax=Pseudorhodoferax sp. Leaf274 TaxID=1736318 RepID=UPI0007024D11|nr:ATP-binding protein [Pseudorhodoferax sp. Leaf274]KQP44192.1 histidine kinase [Pseudorhodoferax sp. Leaf274]
MEVIQAGTPHTLFPMGDASRVGEARRHAALLAQRLGLDDTAAGRLALVVTEMGNNLVRHAKAGRLLIAQRQQGQPEVEVLALDDGPGIADTARALADGFSTGGTPGTGLGAVRRLASDFDLHSEPGVGTVVLARVRPEGLRRPPAAFRWGALTLCAPGELVCGDAWALALDGARAAVLLADGLGHGPHAAEAAQAAVAQFANAPFAALAGQLERMHAALRITRGAAASLALLEAGSLQLAGAGNIASRLVSGTHSKTLAPQNGTLGVQVRRFEPVRADWPPHAVAVLHSDGLQTRWQAEPLAPLVARDPSLMAGWLLRGNLRGRDDATVVVLQRNTHGR